MTTAKLAIPAILGLAISAAMSASASACPRPVKKTIVQPRSAPCVAVKPIRPVRRVRAFKPAAPVIKVQPLLFDSLPKWMKIIRRTS